MLTGKAKLFLEPSINSKMKNQVINKKHIFEMLIIYLKLVFVFCSFIVEYANQKRKLTANLEEFLKHGQQHFLGHTVSKNK